MKPIKLIMLIGEEQHGEWNSMEYDDIQDMMDEIMEEIVAFDNGYSRKGK